MNIKYNLNMASAILSIVFGGLITIGGIWLTQIAYLGGLYSNLLSLNIAYLSIIVLLGVSLVIISSLCVSIKNKTKLGLRITMLSLLSFSSIMEFIAGNIVYGLLLLLPIALEIASVYIKSETDNIEKKALKTNQSTIDAKIAELKHLKDIYVLTDEQYEASIQRLISSIK